MNPLIQPIYDLIKDEKRWTTEYLARNADGVPVRTTSAYATCWCLVGAAEKVYADDPYRERTAIEIMEENVPNGSTYSVGHFNDTHSHAEILAFLESIP